MPELPPVEVERDVKLHVVLVPEDESEAHVTLSGPTAQIAWEVMYERRRQDLKWGGPDHDDEHGDGDWGVLVRDRLPRGTEGAERARLIEAAALIAAWIESLDRLDPR
jgi:hypothetical protein